MVSAGAAVKLRFSSFCTLLCLRQSITNTVSAGCFRGTLEVSFIYYFILLNLQYIDFKPERVECNMVTVETHVLVILQCYLSFGVQMQFSGSVITVFILPQS